MKKLLFLLLLLVGVISANNCVLYGTLNFGGTNSTSQTFYLADTGNITNPLPTDTFTLSTNNSAWLTTNPTSVAPGNGQSSGPISAILGSLNGVPNGVYYVNIMATSVQSSSENCSILATVVVTSSNSEAVWKYSPARWVQQGWSLNWSLDSGTWSVNLIEVSSTTVKFDIYEDAWKAESNVLLGVGANLSEDCFTDFSAKDDGPFAICLLKTQGNSARIQVFNNETSSLVMGEGQFAGGTSQCKLTSTWTSRQATLQPEAMIDITDIVLKNTCTVPIAINSIGFQNVGDPMWTLPTGGTKTLQSGDTFPLDVKIDASGKEEGTYTNTLSISATCSACSPQDVSLSIPLTAIVGGQSSGSNLATPTFNIPSVVTPNTDFVLQVNSVLSSDTVPQTWSPNSGVSCNPNSKHVTNNIWSLKCQLAQGVYKLDLTVQRNSVQIAGNEFTIVSGGGGGMTISMVPELQVNSQSKIAVKDSNGIDLTDIAAITVDGASQKTLTPVYGKTYDVRVVLNGYNTADQGFSLPLQQMDFSLQDTIYEGDSVPLVATDSAAGTSINAAFTVDGKAVRTSWIAESGNHSITASATNYTPTTKSFDVLSLPKILLISPDPSTTTVYSGTEITLAIDNSVLWRVVNSNTGEVVKAGTGSQMVFTPAKAGNYSVQAQGRQITAFTIQENRQIWDIELFGFQVKWILVGVIALVLVLYLIHRSGGSKGGVGYGFPQQGDEIVEKD